MRRCFIIRFYLQNSRAHGLIYTVTGRTRIQRFVWIVSISAAMAIFLYYLSQNVKKYHSEEITANIDAKGVAFIPPDLHLCPINAFRYLSTKNIADTAAFQRSLDAKTSYVRRLAANEKIAKTIFWSNYNLTDLYNLVGHVPKRTIFYHVASKERLETLPIEVTPNSEYFTCFRLPLRKVKGNMTTRDMLHLYLFLDVYPTPYHNITYTVMDTPLQQVNFYVRHPRLVGPQGVIVFVTPPDLYPHEGSHTVLIKPHAHTFIKLRMQQIQRLKTKRDPCQDKDEYVHYYNRLLGGENTTRYRKSFGDCVIRKQLEAMWKKNPDCRCALYNLPITMQYKMLNNCLDWELDHKTLAKHIECVETLLQFQESSETKECYAEDPCVRTTYTTDTWTSHWPNYGKISHAVRHELKQYLRLSHIPEISRLINESGADSALMNFAVVSISPGEVRSKLVKEQRSYEFEKFFSDTGGVAGLCIGMSILSMLEFVNIIHDVILGFLRGDAHNSGAYRKKGNLYMDYIMDDDRWRDSITTTSDSCQPTFRIDSVFRQFSVMEEEPSDS